MTARSVDAPSYRVLADSARANARVSPTLFGLFFEDLNRSLDGGLNANMVANYSFDDVYLERRLHNELIAMAVKRRPRRIREAMRHWRVEQGSIVACGEGAQRAGGMFARADLDRGEAVLENAGYQQAGSACVPSMTTRSDTGTLFGADVRVQRGDLRLRVELVDAESTIVSAAEKVCPASIDWQRVEMSLPASRDARVSLRVRLAGSGSCDLDEVSLMHADFWGSGDDRWSQGRLRRDLVEALQALSPTFLRFPGGCIVEGIGDGNAYDWKKTVGPLRDRVPDFSLWALRTPGGDYSQSNQIGFYEYFLLCEDLGIAAMPVISAGISCQFRSRQSLTTGGDEFARLRADARDLVEWATGDPATSHWAALRAQAGHPAPFELKYIGIGNENHGPDYLEKFDILRADLEAAHPGLRFVLSAGPFSKGGGFDQSWAYARASETPVIVDEHFYKRPEWLIEHDGRYDTYPRGGPTVFLGEYAAHPATSGIPACQGWVSPPVHSKSVPRRALKDHPVR